MEDGIFVRDNETFVGLATPVLLNQLTPDLARRVAAALCVAAEHVDERDTERSHVA